MLNKNRTATNLEALLQSQQSTHGKKPGRWVFKGCGLALLFVVLLGGGIYMLVSSLLNSEDEATIYAPQVSFTGQQQTYLAGIVGYFKAMQVTKTGGSTIRRGTTSYYLLVRSLPEGEQVAKIKLPVEPGQANTLAVLGVQGQKLWVLANGLRCYQMPEGKPIAVPTPAANLQSILPTEARYYVPHQSGPIVWIETLDGGQAWLNMETGLINPTSALPDSLKSIHTAQWASLRRLSRMQTDYTAYLCYADTLAAKGIALLKAEEGPWPTLKTEDLADLRYPHNARQRVRWYQGLYSSVLTGRYIKPEEASMKLMADTAWLQAGWLKHPATGKPFRLAEDYILLHRSLINEDAQLMVSRYSLSGQATYHAALGLVAKNKQLLTQLPWLVSVIYNDELRRDEAIVLHLADGKITRFSVWDD